MPCDASSVCVCGVRVRVCVCLTGRERGGRGIPCSKTNLSFFLMTHKSTGLLNGVICRIILMLVPGI